MGGQFHHDTQIQQGKLDDITEYEPSVKIPDDDIKLLETMTTLRHVDGSELSKVIFIVYLVISLL